MGRFPFKHLAKYPHMKPEDISVWVRFITNNPNYFDTVDYDVPLGKGVEVSTAYSENLRKDYKILTQKKVDVIGYKDENVYLVEVKPVADMRALGQIITYNNLYSNEFISLKIPISLVVCGNIERELENVYKANNILIEAVNGINTN